MNGMIEDQYYESIDKYSFQWYRYDYIFWIRIIWLREI